MQPNSQNMGQTASSLPCDFLRAFVFQLQKRILSPWSMKYVHRPLIGRDLTRRLERLAPRETPSHPLECLCFPSSCPPCFLPHLLYTHAFLLTSSEPHKVCNFANDTWGGPSYALEKEEGPGHVAKGSSVNCHRRPGRSCFVLYSGASSRIPGGRHLLLNIQLPENLPGICLLPVGATLGP